MLNGKALEDYQLKRKKLFDFLMKNEDKVDSLMLDQMIKFVNYSDRYIKYLLHLLELDKVSADILKKSNQSLENVILDYQANKGFNEDKAKKWLVNALVMVAVKEYSYNYVYFEKDGKKISKQAILKTKENG